MFLLILMENATVENGKCGSDKCGCDYGHWE